MCYGVLDRGNKLVLLDKFWAAASVEPCFSRERQCACRSMGNETICLQSVLICICSTQAKGLMHVFCIQVPKDMLIRHMGGLDIFKEYVVEKILNETLPAVRTSFFFPF